MTTQLEDQRSKDFLVREEKIERLERLMVALAQAAARNPDQKGKIRAGIASALKAECTICQAQIDGENLLVLAELANAGEKPGIKRLRQGLCAREKCHSSYYRVHLGQHPDVDWPALFSKDEEPAAACDTAAEAEAVDPVLLAERRKKKILRLIILLVVLLLALLLRQIYFGGTIPLLRQPEKFHVDPSPVGSATD